MGQLEGAVRFEGLDFLESEPLGSAQISKSY
jgi:hypothetical protein